MSNPIEVHKAEFAAVMEFLDQELKNLRSGRASASMVESVQVEAYGSMMELKGVASISIPDSKTIQIEPWDKGLTKDIEKALIAADLGMQPNTAGTVIRLVIPAMTEENRKRLVKQVHEHAEQTRISLRNVREKIREEVQRQEKDKEIGEDEKFRLQEQLDKLVSEWNAKVETTAKKKEEEIMTI
ncbi:MAG TPA: ribosome recycling factor [Candidatus Methylomirabilis sp.]|nr:ribosome recycling factor [Candidatus Methylomirabilis sp.]